MSIKFDWSKFDWLGAIKAVGKALLPFISGALGGLLTGCTVGSGPNFTF